MKEIKFDEIKNVYSGKRGCMCGCLGKYYYKESFNKDKENPPNEDNKVRSDKMVRKVINLMNKHEDVVTYEVYGNVDIWYLEMKDTDDAESMTNRVYCIWSYNNPIDIIAE